VAANIVDLAYAPLFEFADKVPIYIVPGNHERSVLPVSLYLSHPNIHVFNDPTTFTVPLDRTRLTLSGFPFERVDIRGRFKSLVAQTGWQQTPADIRLLCMHQTVEGATVGPNGYRFRFGRDVVRWVDLPLDFVALLSGHIHRKQVLRQSSGLPVIYPGSTQPTSFAEKSETKGFFEILINRHPQNGWQLADINFHTLPTRSMQDVILDSRLGSSELVSHLQYRLARLDANAIVRLKWQGLPSRETQAVFSPSYLRSILPEGMNFQLSNAHGILI